jgi:rhodanese-related sulfurtransferase
MTHIVPTIDIQTLEQWIKTDNVTLLDVREESEFEECAIVGAISLPLSDFSTDDIPQHPHKKIVFQCRSGQRSERACFRFLQDYPEVEAYNLQGGILAWIAAKLPINTNPN